MKMRTANSSGAAGGSAAGFTLVETIMAVAMFGIVVGALYSCFGFGFSIVRSAREDLQATQILLSRIERARLCTWTASHGPEFQSAHDHRAISISKNQRTPCTVTFTAVEPPAGSVPDGIAIRCCW